MNDYFCVEIGRQLKRIADAKEKRNDEVKRKYAEAVFALHRIAAMEPGEHDVEIGSQTYVSVCGTCNEMIAIAKMELKKARVGGSE